MAQQDKIVLPKPFVDGKMSLEAAIVKRRSHRAFESRPLTWEQMGQLLWAAQGVTSPEEGRSLRAAPSAGALYPLELYALTPQGVFHYLPDAHALELKVKSDLRRDLATAAFGQDSISQAPFSIVLSAVYARVTKRYGDRGILYAHEEIGHAAQNVLLEAVALGLGSVPVGAFNESAVKELLELSDEETPLYIIPVGYAR